MKYVLKKPITIGDTEVTAFTFREEICAGDMRGLKVKSALSDPSVDDILTMAGRIAGQPDVVMNKICGLDLAEVTILVMGFLSAGRETGTTP